MIFSGSILGETGKSIISALEFINQNSGAFIVLLVAVLILFSWRYLRIIKSLITETKKAREFETEPNITIFTQYEYDQSNHVKNIFLTMKNIGRGYARNLVLNFPRDVKKVIITEYNKINPDNKIAHIINTPGIPQLAPDDQITLPVKSLIQLIRQKTGDDKRFLPVVVNYDSVEHHDRRAGHAD